jgi:tripeptide aminopeptidase
MTKAWLKNTMNKVGKTKRKHKLEVIETPKREVITVPGLTAIPKMDLAIKPDYERLIMLLNMRTYSRGKLQNKLIDKLDEHFSNLGAVTEKDSYGNLYVTKGNAEFYPCVVGHTDINQQERANVKIVSEYPWMFGFDLNKAEQAGMGADDKVGVYFAVHMFDLFDNIKLFFPKDEEIGLVGTYAANKEFFTDCSMLVQLDRNSYKNDLINYTNGIEVCSEEFVTAAKPIMDKYMYATNRGSCTDIGGIKKFDTVNCVAMNVSCGYINEHSSEEVISMPHFENAINFGYELLKMGVDKVWNHKPKQEVYENSYYGRYGNYGYSYNGGSLWDDSLDDPFSETAAKPGTYKAESINNQTVYLDEIDKDNDEYLTHLYQEFASEDVRNKQLKQEFSFDFGYITKEEANNYSQGEIDELIIEETCPCCWSPLTITNRLLLYTQCESCDSLFNIPKDATE